MSQLCAALLLLTTWATAEEVARVEKSSTGNAVRLGPGNHIRPLVVGELTRTALVHVPEKYNPTKPIPLVLALHGAAMNGEAMVGFCGLNATADEKGFVVVYPDGTGPGPLLTWNAGGFRSGLGSQANDVAFLDQLIDDIGRVVTIDPKRTYACGMSNGGMMCYRLAAELSHRIAAIAPVAGTMAISEVHPTRPVSVIHFHGTRDTLVPYEKEESGSHFWLRIKAVDDSILTWRKLNGCDSPAAAVEVLSREADGLEVTRSTYGPGVDGAEVVLIKVEGGGHTWPGRVPPIRLLGKSAMKVSANELIWAFFEKHPMK